MNDPKMKAALGEPLDFIMRKSINGTTFNILSEPLSTTPGVMYFQKNSYLTKTFSDWIQIVFESGLIDYWIKIEKSIEMSKKVSDNEPKVITIHDLLAPYIFYIAGLVISSSVFIVEIIFHNYRRIKIK